MCWSDSFLLRVLIYLWIWLSFFVMVAMYKPLFARWLEYLATWVMRFMLAPVRLVTSALSSAVAWTRLVNDSYIPIRLLAP